jgi:F0F1-type ATP synthase assembly protein I
VEQRPSFGLWELVTLGSVMVASLLGGTGLGLWLDAHFDTLPVFTLVGLGVGIVFGALMSYLRIRHYLS